MIFNVIKKAKQLLYDDSNTGLGVNNVQDAIDDLTQAIVEVDAVNESTGSPILLTDTANGVLTDFKAYGRSTQDGEPTPDSPQAIDSVADSGYFDGELLQGYYNESGVISSNSSYVCSKNLIPCNSGDNVKLAYAGKIGSITFNFYDKDMNVLSRPSNSSEVTEYEATAPTNAKYVHFMFREVNTAITPQTAKHITVTINGKYALIVKSVGKNLLNCRGLSARTSEGVTFTPIYDDNENLLYVNANGTATETALFQLPVNLENGQYIINGCSNGSASTYGLAVQVRVNNTSNTWYASYTGEAQFETSDTKVCTYCFVQVNKGTTVNNVKFYPMIRLVGTDGTYEPYKEEVKYIPLNEPLRSSLDGSVSDVASLTEVNRRFAEIVFDGSESWALFSTNTFAISGVSAKANRNAVCSHYKYSTDGANNTFYIRPSGTITFVDTTCATLAEWKAKLQANPITIQYELAEPITETIEPVDIVTYDNVTYLTASDNAEMWVEYYSNSSVGQRLAKTDEQMKAMRTELDNMIPTTTGTGAVFCKSGNVVVLHLNGVTTRIDNKSRCLLDISTDVFAQFPPVYVSATKPTQYLVVFRDSETNAVSTAVAKIIQDNGRYYVQILPIMSGTLADNADGTVNGTITYLTDRSI